MAKSCMPAEYQLLAMDCSLTNSLAEDDSSENPSFVDVFADFVFICFKGKANHIM